MKIIVILKVVELDCLNFSILRKSKETVRKLRPYFMNLLNGPYLFIFLLNVTLHSHHPKRDTNLEIFKRTCSETLQNYIEFLHIYTDGSTVNNETGVALLINEEIH